jgi:single-stranded DNA-specific DHH superfamily exonuclease
MNKQEERNLSQVNIDKAEFSPRYENWFEATLEDPTMEMRLRTLKDEIFDNKITSTGRKFSDILLTTEELAEQGRYVFGQEEVTEYESKESQKKRARTLDKGDLFEPKVVLKTIVSSSQRENREEGLNRPGYRKAIQQEVVKYLVTSGCSIIEALSLLAKGTQLATNEEWITEEEWVGEGKLDSEEIDVKLARKYADILEIDLDDLILHHQRVEKINSSGPTYINKHDQHIVPSSQGGLSQRPVAISSHWFEHSLVANDSAEALSILLAEKELGATEDEEALDKMIELTFFAYQINSQAAELLRGSIPLSPSLSTKYILEKRKEICIDARAIINKTILLDQNNHLDILSEEDIESLVSLAERMSKTRGTLERAEKDEEDTEAKEVLTFDESIAIEKLELVVELLDRDSAVNRLKTSLDSLRRIGKTPRSGLEHISKEEFQTILMLIKRLESGHKALYLHDMNEEEYKAILSLQDALDDEILIDIAVPTKIRNVRPAWRYRLDLELISDVLVNPYDDKGLEIRMLLDVLQEPVFERIFPTGSPPRRSDFTEEQLEQDKYLSDRVYGDLRYVEVLEGLIANNMLNEYYKSLGVENKKEMLEAMFPNENAEEPPSALQNVDKAAKIVYRTVVSNNKIATIGDCDQDGFFASINWRWILEHVGVDDVEQKFNTRLEGHAVQPRDLLNLALKGSDLIIINDTGSSEQDTKTFSLIKNGVQSIEDLLFFRENIEGIQGFSSLTKHVQRQIKTKLTRFINEHKDDKDLDLTELLETRFTTGKTYIDDSNNKKPEYKSLSDYAPLVYFLEGFPDLKIIVCDHHTPSIEAIEYFRDNEDVIMVNPEWVRNGYEEKFIEEMKLALKPNDKGEVNIEEINKVQRKYTCYPESDIVGTVTTGKVIKRFLQLLTDEEIVREEATEIYSLDAEARKNKYRELAQIVSKGSKESTEDLPLPTEIHIMLDEDTDIELSLEGLWMEKAPMDKITSRINQSVSSLGHYVTRIKQNGLSQEESITLLKELEAKWGLVINNKEDFLSYIKEESFSLDKDSVSNRTIDKIDTLYKRRIEEVTESDILSKGELRFYLDYAKRLPKSFFLLPKDEKEEYILPTLFKLSTEIDRTAEIEAIDGSFSINLTDIVQRALLPDDNPDKILNLRDLKIHLFDLIEQGYDENGGIPENPRTGEVPDKRTKVRYEGNKIWNEVIERLQKRKRLTPMEMRAVDSFFKYGPYGFEFINLTEATATLGDGGSVDLGKGRENRAIVRNGMNAIEKFTDDYWEATGQEKSELKRIQPEILRLIRTSLRGTHIKSVNWHLSRLLTHGVSAFVNAMYRRGKEERSERAKEFWTEAADFCIRRSDNETTRRHRHTLVYAQEVSIERREELFEQIAKDLDNNHGELEKPIIITKLEGRKYVDPTKGLRGLIAGQLAGRYEKPTMVIVEEKAETNGTAGRYSVSFRLPAKGNVAADMVQLGLAINEIPGIKILAHGGHPEAAGGTWEVKGGKEKLHEVLDPIFLKYEIENPDAGIVKVEEVIERTAQSLEEEGWGYLGDYREYVNTFDVADTIAASMYKQTNPYGVNMPGLMIEFEDLTVVSRSNGVKNDGDEYCNLMVRDKRGNVKTMRLFKNLADLNQIHKGDTVTLRAQPIMRLRALGEGNLEYNWPIPGDTEQRISASTVVGEKAKPHLDIDKIMSIRRGN